MRPNNNIVVAGLGRCGTTYIYMTLLTSGWKNGNFFEDFNSKEFKHVKGFAFKTHSYPPEIKDLGATKIIFMYGNPYNIVKSAHSAKMNIKMHYKHMSADFSKHENYTKEDTLRLEEQFDSWCKYADSIEGSKQLLFLRYEDIPNQYKTIADFCEHKLKFTHWKDREFKNVTDPNILKTYKNLYEKIESQPTKIY